MYVRISGRALVNVASLNAQGRVGNLMELAKSHVLCRTDEGYRLVEVPVITGNSFKRWHFAHFIEVYKSLGGQQLCDYCERLIGFRSPDKKGSSEEYFVKKCAGEDVHGFLQPDNQVRRDSLVKASFIVPVEELEHSVDTVTHNRVVVNESGVVSRDMMIIKRQYSSALYGFQLNMDLAYVGKLLFSGDAKDVLNKDERERRVKAALLALLPLLSGQLGASRSRAEPVWKVEELVVACSAHPLPSLTHGHYSDYFSESVKTLASFSRLFNVAVHMYAYGVSEALINELAGRVRGVQAKRAGAASGSPQREKGGEAKLVIEVVDSWQEIVEKLVGKL